MNDNRKQTAMVLSLVAVSAAVISGMVLWKSRTDRACPKLRSVGELLTECDTRIQQIREHLTETPSQVLMAS